MDYYLALNTVHIISETILFRTGLGTAFHMWTSHRSGRLLAINRGRLRTFFSRGQR